MALEISNEKLYEEIFGKFVNVNMKKKGSVEGKPVKYYEHTELHCETSNYFNRKHLNALLKYPQFKEIYIVDNKVIVVFLVKNKEVDEEYYYREIEGV